MTGREEQELSSWGQQQQGPTTAGSSSSWGLPARRSLHHILSQISLEDLADKMGRLFVRPTSVIGWTSSSSMPVVDEAQPTTPDDWILAPSSPIADEDELNQDIVRSSGDDSVQLQEVPQTPPPPPDDDNNNLFSLAKEQEDDNYWAVAKDGDSWKTTMEQQKVEEIKCSSCLCGADTRRWGEEERTTYNSRRDHDVIDEEPAIRPTAYVLYDLPMFAPPSGGQENFSASVDRWNNRLIPMFLVST